MYDHGGWSWFDLLVTVDTGVREFIAGRVGATGVPVDHLLPHLVVIAKGGTWLAHSSTVARVVTVGKEVWVRGWCCVPRERRVDGHARFPRTH